MESKRQKQVAEVVKRNFGYILQQEGSYMYGTDALVTVTLVKMSADLQTAKIYLSVYNSLDKSGIIKELEGHYSRLKGMLAHRVRKHVRRIPDIQFFLDDTLDEMHRLNVLFDRLEAENQMGLREEEE